MISLGLLKFSTDQQNTREDFSSDSFYRAMNVQSIFIGNRGKIWWVWMQQYNSKMYLNNKRCFYCLIDHAVIKVSEKSYLALTCYVIFCIDEKSFCMKRNAIFFKNSYVSPSLKETMHKIPSSFITLRYESVTFW